jgi:hypothetical protein
MAEQVLKQTNTTPHTVPLTATVVGSTVVINGDGGASLLKDSGAHRFEFTLTSPPGLTVQFDSLDAEDDCSTCPPAKGDNSKQIVGVHIGKDGDTAAFTDNNSNKDPMDVAYQWNFVCSDPSKQVQPFDPVIKNGGSSTPPGQ